MDTQYIYIYLTRKHVTVVLKVTKYRVNADGSRVTLPHVRSTTSRSTQSSMSSVITKQQTSIDIESTLLQRPTAVGYWHIRAR